MAYSKLFLFSTMLIAIFFWCGQCFAWPVPDTGQTESYTDIHGEDSDYRINPPSYTKLNEQGDDLSYEAQHWVMVRDNVTGLIWEVKQQKDGEKDYFNPHDADNTYTWYDSNPDTNGGNAGNTGDGFNTEAFIKALNDAQFGGFSDWRLPTRKELLASVDFGRYNPTINITFFPNTQANDYWSSTTQAGSNSRAWTVRFYHGNDSTYTKDNLIPVRAVRGGKAPTATLVDNGDGTVTDTSTGLMWQKEDDSSTYLWEDALSHCQTISLAGYKDWRLPNVKELDSLSDLKRRNPSIDPDFFFQTKTTTQYWTSTTRAINRIYAWRISFLDGALWWSTKSSVSLYVRAVRGGQPQFFGHVVIWSPGQGSSWQGDDLMPIRWNTAGINGKVRISLSTQGGKEGTFETIIDSTDNNGSYDWIVQGVPSSVNCALRIEPLENPDRNSTQSLFGIALEPVSPGDVNNDENIDLSDLILVLQILSGLEPSTSIYVDAGLDGNGRIGLKEAIFILQDISEMR